MAHAMELAPPERIDVLDLDVWRIVSLPSGRIWITRGFLEAMEDEAQLAFILGHEMAHTAAGDAAARFIRLGLIPLVREGADDQKMEESLADLSRLGFGRRRERQADEAALRGLLACGFATGSIGDLLERAAARYARGDTAPAEWIFAHPPVRDRCIRLEIAEHVGSRTRRTPKINREVFRRVVTGAFESDRMRRPMKDDPTPRLADDGFAPTRGSGRWMWWVLGIAGLTAAILSIAHWLGR